MHTGSALATQSGTQLLSSVCDTQSPVPSPQSLVPSPQAAALRNPRNPRNVTGCLLFAAASDVMSTGNYSLVAILVPRFPVLHTKKPPLPIMWQWGLRESILTVANRQVDNPRPSQAYAVWRGSCDGTSYATTRGVMGDVKVNCQKTEPENAPL